MKRRITGISLFAAIAVIILSGCTKDNGVMQDGNDSPYYVRFNVNGVKKEFSQVPMSMLDFHDSVQPGTGWVHLYQFGMGNQGLKETLSFTVISTGRLEKDKAYKEANTVAAYFPELQFSYSWPLDNKHYFSTAMYELYDISSFPKNCTLTITETGAGYIKGNFSGTVYRLKDNDDPDTNDKITLTDGEFFLAAAL